MSVQDCDTGSDKAGLQHHRRKDLVQFNRYAYRISVVLVLFPIQRNECCLWQNLLCQSPGPVQRRSFARFGLPAVHSLKSQLLPQTPCQTLDFCRCWGVVKGWVNLNPDIHFSSEDGGQCDQIVGA